MISYPTILKFSATFGTLMFLSACAESFEGVTSTSDPAPLRAIGEDRGRDAGPLSTMQAGIYIDPDGCQIWIVLEYGLHDGHSLKGSIKVEGSVAINHFCRAQH